MSLRFYFGPSGSGKSRQLYQEMVERAGKEPDRNFFIIVPDQFTMETQKDLVVLSPRGGILNIDVLSFGRLSYRILEEVGRKETPILDDTGKSLVLQKVAAGLVEELPVLGSLLHKQGYIHEVKSAVSEFMQYGISTQDVFTLSEYAKKRGALSLKLRDLGVLYQGFSDYIRDRFITTEETLDVLRRSLKKSRLLPDSVVVFDGFTGFTPIQERVIQEMMGICREITVTVTMGAGENPYEQDGEQKLFHLSKKTVARLERLAKEALGGAGVERQRDVFLLPGEKAQPGEKVLSGEAAGRCQVMRNPHHRFCKAPALAALEKNLFRYRVEPYEEQIEAFAEEHGLLYLNTLEHEEIGIDMDQFPNSQHFCSWAGLSPGNNKSAARQKSTRINQGNIYLKEMLCEIGWVIAAHRNYPLSGWYWSVKQRRGGKRAVIAVARKILALIYIMLKRKTPYDASHFEARKRQNDDRRARRMVNELRKLGYAITAPTA